MITRCSCTADRCTDHGEHIPCSLCAAELDSPELAAREAATLSSLRLAKVATPGWTDAVRKAPRQAVFVERHQ